MFDRSIALISERFSQFPDKRVGSNSFIKMKDIGLSAFSVFFTQSPSFLEHQQTMRCKNGNDNANSLFNIDHIPSDNHIRNLLDSVAPSEVFPILSSLLFDPKIQEPLEQFRYFDGQLLIALDGVHYFSSHKISCSQCSTQVHANGKTTYSHSMVSATIVSPSQEHVLPLIPSFIEPQDGHEKQDCEREATKRWLLGVGHPYAKLKATLLGDDLYCCEPICKLSIKQGFHFIFTCKPNSHKCLYEWVDSLNQSGDVKQITKVFGTTKGKQTWQIRYVNEVPIKNAKDSLTVNWCEVEVIDSNGKLLYHNSFATDHLINDDNVFAIIKAGRTRWKIENEHNNTLKNHGYYLEHNYGHGKQYLSQLLTTLILLSFLLHTVLALTDASYQMVRKHFSRKSFFNQLRTLLMYLYFMTWATLMAMMLTACIPPPKRQRKK